MKYIILVTISISIQAFATDLTRPTRCLFRTGGNDVSETCAVFNKLTTTIDVSVCMYDSSKSLWKKGIWRAQKTVRGVTTAAHFEYKHVCDRGVEYITLDSNLEPVGPKLYSSAEVNYIPGVSVTSIYSPDLTKTGERDGKVPVSCFFSQAANGESSNSQACDTDPLLPNYCELRKVNSLRGYSAWYGYFWVRYTNNTRTAFNVCVGGILMRNATADDLVVKKITHTDVKPITNIGDQVAKICFLAVNGPAYPCSPIETANGYCDTESVHSFDHSLAGQILFNAYKGKQITLKTLTDSGPPADPTLLTSYENSLAVAQSDVDQYDDKKHYTRRTIAANKVITYPPCLEMIVTEPR